MKSQFKAIALIPARSGSKRVPNKNIKYLHDHPLIAYSIKSAIESRLFDKVVCVTDDENYAKIAKYYGAEVPQLRPLDISGDKSFDIEWVNWILSYYLSVGEKFDVFSILRPTSPFRLPSTIQRAFNIFYQNKYADSLRAVQKVSEHPGKMWVINENVMYPLLPMKTDGVPWHSSQYASLPEIYVQNARLEIAWTRIVFNLNSISGNIIQPFITQELEGFDINNPEDWTLAESYVRNNSVSYVAITNKPYKLL